MPEDLDKLDPEMNQTTDMDTPDMGADEPATDHGDQEGAMAKQELIKLANYATSLQEHITDGEQLEAWVQAKITMAATNIASVYHYMAYEKKIGEYSDALENTPMSESKRQALTNWLMEAKSKVKELKKTHAEKVKEKKVDEGVMSGGEQPCEECGGTGVVHMPGIQPHPSALAKVEKYKKLIKATHAAHKRMNGQDSPETEVDEEASSTGGTITRTKTGLRHQHNPARFSDEPHAEIASKVKARSASEKKSEKDMDKADEKESKAWGKANPGKQTIMKGGVKTTNESKMSPANMAHHHACEYAKHHKTGNLELAMHHLEECEKCGGVITHGSMGECYHTHPHLNNGQMYECGGYVMEAKSKMAKKDYDGDGKIESGKDEYLGSRIAAAKKAGKLKEGQKCNECGMMMEKCSCMHESAEKTMSRAAKGVMKYGKEGMKALAKAGKEGKDLDTVRNKYDKYDESAPSAGLSKAKKSATVKAAKKGEDIGKPGKSFKKVAAKAAEKYGSKEKGEKVAAAAMWKNIKETTAYIAEKAKAAKPDYIDLDKDGNKTEPMKKAAKDAKKETVKESAEVDRMRELTGRLNRTEKPVIVENREVDQIRALTQRLLG